MSRFLSSVICAVLLSTFSVAAPAPQSVFFSSTAAVSSAASTASVVPSAKASSVASAATVASAASATPTVAYASDNANLLMWNPDTNSTNVEPIRGELGGTILGPQNVPLQQQNPDLLAPPTTDHGTV